MCGKALLSVTRMKSADLLLGILAYENNYLLGATVHIGSAFQG
jgi:hypothetical protein